MRSLVCTLARGRSGLLLSPGPGWERCEGAARALAARGAGALVVIGVCGGLHPRLGAGDLIVAREVFREGEVGQWRRKSASLQTGEGLWQGPLVTTCAPVCTPREKGELYERTGALGADLESAAIRAVARRAGLPFLAVRAVCDPAGRDLPPPLAALASGDGAVGPASLFFLLLRRPALLPKALRLGADFWVARRALGEALAVAEDCLPAEGADESIAFLNGLGPEKKAVPSSKNLWHQ